MAFPVECIFMCGIVGYVGSKGVDGRSHGALDVILEGLRRLEYRGYDSAGVAVIADHDVEYRKKAGKLSNLIGELEADPLPESTICLLYTSDAADE